MTGRATVHVVVPEAIDDPARPSGGNVYDRRLCESLRDLGWAVRMHHLAGAWPEPDAVALAALTRALAQVRDGATVLVDGLIASLVPEVLVPAAELLQLVVLMHMPLGGQSDHARVCEGAVLRAAAAVVTTSQWSRQRLLSWHGLDPVRAVVAHPGVDIGAPATGTDGGGSLLCVGAVSAEKGHDVLMRALALVARAGPQAPWRCVCVGSLTRAPGFLAELRAGTGRTGIDDHVVFTGPRTGHELDATYAAADVLVLPSRTESYGMVVTEALARAIPVIASHVGGVPEALGRTATGEVPGLLVASEDVDALAEAIGGWLADAALRARLRASARQRRACLSDWSTTAAQVSQVLWEVAA